MKPIELLLWIRGAERLLIELGAVACVVMGTQLFRLRLAQKSNIEATLGPVSVKMTETAPGLVMALFGMLVLGYGLFSRAEITEWRDELNSEQADAAGGNANDTDHGANEKHDVKGEPPPAPPPNPEAKGGGIAIGFGGSSDLVGALLSILGQVDPDSVGTPREALTSYKTKAEKILSQPTNKLLRRLTEVEVPESDESAREILRHLKAELGRVRAQRERRHGD